MAMKKKLLVLLGTEPKWGGEHQYASTIMEFLADGGADGIELAAVCCNRYWRKWCRENGVRVLNESWYSFTEREQQRHLRFPIWSRICSMYFSGLGKILRHEKFDAVLCTIQGFVPNMSLKIIIPAHDLMHRYERDFPEVGKEYGLRERYYASNAKYAWCVMTDSNLGRKQFLESYADCMKRRKPHVAVMPFTVPDHIAECREEFLETPEKYVFYPAQFWKHKNHMNLIKAVKLVAEEINDIHLVLAGSEKNNMNAVKKYISENRLENYITIKGFVSNENIAYLYKHAVGMVMPSYFGPTNIPPLEAMALGCPVAVSNRYAMPEQVGSAGLLFNPDSPEEIAECIRKMWRDDALRQRMIEKGYERAGRWTQKEFGERLKKILVNI